MLTNELMRRRSPLGATISDGEGRRRSGCDTMAGPLIYGAMTNKALLSMMPVAGRVLDIGCGEGAWSDALRSGGATVLVGIEPCETAAVAASKRYDKIVSSPVEEVDLDAIGCEPFDLIVAADIIEHLVDPWAQLARWRSWIVTGGHLAVSVPNLRDPRIIWRLTTRGDFFYSDAGGVMDRTHLRWFTRRTLDRDLRHAGWIPEQHGGAFGPLRDRLNQLTMRRYEAILAHQLHVIARA